MSNEITVNTPESAAFSLEPAGLGSRFLALAVDMIIQTLAVILLFTAFGTVANSSWLFGISDVGLAVFILLVAVVLSGYHIFFEAVWSGRSPGKRLVGLRVVKTTGVPIGFWDACLRNLVRIIDFLPSGYLLGAVTIIISPQQRRLGDYAAGTLVVRERRTAAVKPLVEFAAPPGPGNGAVAPVAAATAVATVAVLSYREQELIAEFLTRRHHLTKEARGDLARRLADRLLTAGVTAASLNLPQWAADEDLLVAWYEQSQR